MYVHMYIRKQWVHVLIEGTIMGQGHTSSTRRKNDNLLRRLTTKAGLQSGYNYDDMLLPIHQT